MINIKSQLVINKLPLLEKKGFAERRQHLHKSTCLWLRVNISIVH